MHVSYMLSVMRKRVLLRLNSRFVNTSIFVLAEALAAHIFFKRHVLGILKVLYQLLVWCCLLVLHSDVQPLLENALLKVLLKTYYCVGHIFQTR